MHVLLWSEKIKKGKACGFSVIHLKKSKSINVQCRWFRKERSMHCVEKNWNRWSLNQTTKLHKCFYFQRLREKEVKPSEDFIRRRKLQGTMHQELLKELLVKDISLTLEKTYTRIMQFAELRCECKWGEK